MLLAVKIYLGNSMPQLHLAFEHCPWQIENVLIDFSKNVLPAVPFSFTADAAPYF